MCAPGQARRLMASDTKPFRASEAGFRENLLRADCDDYLPVRFRNPKNLVFLAGAASTDMSIGGQKRPCP
jgi:hypothetical protein